MRKIIWLKNAGEHRKGKIDTMSNNDAEGYERQGYVKIIYKLASKHKKKLMKFLGVRKIQSNIALASWRCPKCKTLVQFGMDKRPAYCTGLNHYFGENYA